jgi:transposase
MAAVADCASNFGGLSKDYERLPEMSEAAIYAVMIRVVLKRLAT